MSNQNSNGIFDISLAPSSVSLSSGSNLSGIPGKTRIKYGFYCPGTVTFDWAYTHTDPFGPIFDYPEYSINGGASIMFSAFNQMGSNIQNGLLQMYFQNRWRYVCSEFFR